MFLFLYMLCIFSPARARADRGHGGKRAVSGTLFFGCRCYVKSIDRLHSIRIIGQGNKTQPSMVSAQAAATSLKVRHIEGQSIVMRGGAVR